MCKKTLGVASLLLVIGSTACGSKSGESIGAVALQPPVKAATPAGLKSSTYASLNNRLFNLASLSHDAIAATNSDLQTIKDRFFSPGPTDFIDRLGKIDGRLAEFDLRALDKKRTCLGEEAKLWNPNGLPSSATFPMYFSCSETMTGGELKVYFGKKDGYFYVAELQTKGKGPKMGTLAKANTAGTQVEAWQFSVEDPDTTKSNWLQIKADRNTKIVEISGASQSAGTGVGCGVQIKTSADYVYGNGRFGDIGAPPSNNCTSLPAITTPCAAASTLDDKSGLCTGDITSFSVVSMSYTSLNQGNANLSANSLIDNSGIPTLTDFNSQSP